MEQQNQGTSSNKRKRGRPRRDESQVKANVTSNDENLIGQVVSGVVEGSFEAGYFLNVKVADTEKYLKGVVFLSDKVTPVTSTTDLFPQAKMYARQDISSNQQQAPPPTNQTATCTTLLPEAGVGSDAIDERNLPIDTQIKDNSGSTAEEKLTEPEDQTLSLLPQFANDNTVLRSEPTTTSPKDSPKDEGTTTLSLEIFQNETKPSGTEEEKKSSADAEPCGLDLTVKEKPASSVADDVPEELQLELGNKNTSASATATEAKSGFLANLFEGRVEEPNAASQSGFPEATEVNDDKDS